MEKKPFLDVIEIQKRIPHRFPFLLIDKIVSYQEGPDPKKKTGRKVVAIKNVTINEHYFSGHFPNKPVMPGVLQIEAMAQAGAVACVPREEDRMDVLIAKVSEARFRRPVVPGDTLEIHAEIVADRSSVVEVKAEMYCEGQIVAEVTILAKIFELSEGKAK
jgi:beta-hydroxyacyl-ACP dehydratase FabZ